MYLLPQEIEVWYIIPAIRKYLAQYLIKEHHLTYGEAGEILGITKSAVSQYVSDKRANKIKLKSKVKKEIRKSAEILAENPKRGLVEIQRLLKFMKENHCSCSVCKKFNKEILKYCNCRPIY